MKRMIKLWRTSLLNKSKAETFVGFAMRTGKFRIGFNAILTLKRIGLVIVCKSTSENSLEKIKSAVKKYKCPLYMTTEKTLEEITHKENAKVMAIYDNKLVKAILQNVNQDFVEMSLEK